MFLKKMKLSPATSFSVLQPLGDTCKVTGGLVSISDWRYLLKPGTFQIGRFQGESYRAVSPQHEGLVLHFVPLASTNNRTLGQLLSAPPPTHTHQIQVASFEQGSAQSVHWGHEITSLRRWWGRPWSVRNSSAEEWSLSRETWPPFQKLISLFRPWENTDPHAQDPEETRPWTCETAPPRKWVCTAFSLNATPAFLRDVNHPCKEILRCSFLQSNEHVLCWLGSSKRKGSTKYGGKPPK